MALPLINGITYSWNNITAVVMGVPIAGITNIEYSDEQEMEDNMGAGAYAVNRGYGAYKATGKLTVYMEEVEALSKASVSGRVQDLPPFDIIVSYVSSGNIPVIHKLRNVQFKNNNRKTKTGDKKIEVELDLLMSHIDWK